MAIVAEVNQLLYHILFGWFGFSNPRKKEAMLTRTAKSALLQVLSAKRPPTTQWT